MIAPSYNGDTCQGLESGFAAKSKVALLQELTLMLRLGLKATQLASRLQVTNLCRFLLGPTVIFLLFPPLFKGPFVTEYHASLIL